MITLNFFANYNCSLGHRMSYGNAPMELEQLAARQGILVQGFHTKASDNSHGWVLEGDYEQLSDWVNSASHGLGFDSSKIERELLSANDEDVTIDTMELDPSQFDVDFFGYSVITT